MAFPLTWGVGSNSTVSLRPLSALAGGVTPPPCLQLHGLLRSTSRQLLAV